MPLAIDRTDLRRVFLWLQRLADAPNRRLGAEGLEHLIERLGFVQVDSVNTVERAHHLILFSRNQTYRRSDLTLLTERTRALFENWTHDAAVIPSRFYPYWRHRFARERERLAARWTTWQGDAFTRVIDDVLQHVRDRGPTRARELEAAEKRGGGWWNWHPGKTALEYLWRTGEIAVHARQNFEKIYDLSERVLPAEHFSADVREEAFIDWACASALDRLGVATPGEIAAFWDLVSIETARAWCQRHAGSRIEPVTIVNGHANGNRAAFARPDIAELIANAPEPPGRVRVLSPFDPVLRDRKRTERLFGFFYRIEIFVPEKKRQYGYYVFPLLEGDRMIGRIDMKAQRTNGRLHVTRLWLEPGVKASAGRMARLEAELERVAKFTGMEQVSYQDGWMRTE